MKRRKVPLHLQTKGQFHESIAARRRKELDVVGKSGDKLLTPIIKQYCEEVIFGGVYRTVEQWARFCGVSSDTIRLWNSMEATDEYMDELRDTRRRMIMENFETTIGTAMSELVKIMKIDFKVQTPDGMVVRPSLVAEKQRGIQTMLEFLRAGREGVNVFFNADGKGGQQGSGGKPQDGKFENDLHGMTKEEIDQELRDLKAIEESSDDDKDGKG